MNTTPPLHIAVVSSEAIPFAKTGGLADVSGTLPLELAKLGQHCSLFMPAYRRVMEDPRFDFENVGSLRITVGKKEVAGTILKYRPGNEGANKSEDQALGNLVNAYLIHQPEYFDRAGIYGEDGKDYSDNCERFSYFCRSVLEAISRLNLPVNILHTNDWQTGLIPALTRTEYASSPVLNGVANVFTIHNLAYQGRFWHWDMAVTGMDWKYFNWRQMEFFGDLSLLKTGIVFADQITTVSPRYAEEIQTSEHGHGMEGILRERSDRLTGIMNGIDVNVWNPQTSPYLSYHYNIQNWHAGKRACKIDLQRKVGLTINPQTPLLGLVGRLASQKGWSILLPVLEKWLQYVNAQWVVLGTGDPEFENALKRLVGRFPDRLSLILKFSDELAHQIEAGSDIFVMPSLYEPCGLNQLYSLRYGTVPVVRRTGGLADSIVDTNQSTLESRSANGFSFGEFTSTDLESALGRAIDCFVNRPDVWKQIVETGMAQDWSWRRSASHYLQVYRHAFAESVKSTSFAN
ncbi:MAG TPA: glycogen synthase GlgA [Pirellulaceae bacterium]|nr:glycogen synthase GlgA [Pirellulaceae bacterium]HMO92124.1 glycogen synthase GlgA [Pirellulaceae bacterium]HMP69288.1 glycogen synthase GlgA [Pirellulaceae bacterium]